MERSAHKRLAERAAAENTGMVEIEIDGFIQDRDDPTRAWDWYGTVVINTETRLPVQVEDMAATVVTADNGHGYVVVTVGEETMEFRRPDLGLGGWI